jgi:transitional endoplasmic reticulum ATPase
MPIDMELKVSESSIEDVGKGWARLDPEDIKVLDSVIGDIIEISGGKKTVARITGAFPELYGKKIIQIDGITRDNAQVNLGDTVRIRKFPRKKAVTVLLCFLDSTNSLPLEDEFEHFGKVLQGLPVILGDKINVPLFGGKDRFFQVEATSPSGAVIINEQTKFVLKKPDYSIETPSHISYEDVGGIENELRLVREMVELPLLYSEVLEKLGIEAPKGVLLYGPPGTGKTLIARAIASETKLHFIKINGPEVIHKFYGESEARLREIFEEATQKAPSIIFIDEIDAIAPKRAVMTTSVPLACIVHLIRSHGVIFSRRLERPHAPAIVNVMTSMLMMA